MYTVEMVESQVGPHHKVDPSLILLLDMLYEVDVAFARLSRLVGIGRPS